MNRREFETGVLVGLNAGPLLLPAQPGQTAGRITAVAVDPGTDSYTLTFADGSQVRGWAEFDGAGQPVELADEAGNAVTFLEGSPVSARDRLGRVVDITLGGA